MKIRQVDASQVDVVHRLNLLQAACLPNDLPAEYKEGDLWFEVPGAAFACIRPVADIPGWWYLARAGVVPEHQGKGLQKRLIRARLKAAKGAGGVAAITDTTYWNYASANSLMSTGFRLYGPTVGWGLPGSLYWRKAL